MNIDKLNKQYFREGHFDFYKFAFRLAMMKNNSIVIDDDFDIKITKKQHLINIFNLLNELELLYYNKNYDDIDLILDKSTGAKYFLYFNKDNNITILLYFETFQEYDHDTNSFGEIELDITIRYYFVSNIENIKWIENLNKKLNENIEKSSSIGFIISQNNSYKIIEKNIKSVILDEDIPYLYGEKLSESLPKLIDILNNSEKGVNIFFGMPGTGKTSFIHYLIEKINKNKRVVFIPSQFTQILIEPAFFSFAMKNLTNSILVIEEAESIIMDRKINPNSPVSSLLNLTDGFISDILKLQIIITYNTDDRIDKALLRKGRLNFQHHFNGLTKEESIELINYKKLDNRIIDKLSNEGNTLANIFNFDSEEEELDENKTNTIGFKR